MAAQLKLYSDIGCSAELSGGSPYTLQIGSVDGLNGSDGEIFITSIWVKNTGTFQVINITLNETSDSSARGSYSLDGTNYNATTISLGDMAVNEIKRIYIKVTIPASSSPSSNIPLNFTVGGYSYS